MICIDFASIQVIDITGNPLVLKPIKHYDTLKSLLHKNISCHLMIKSLKTKSKVHTIKVKNEGVGLNNHSLSLPALKHIKLNENLQNYPRPLNIKSKAASK